MRGTFEEDRTCITTETVTNVIYVCEFTSIASTLDLKCYGRGQINGLPVI